MYNGMGNIWLQSGADIITADWMAARNILFYMTSFNDSSQHFLGILQDDHEENGAEDFVPHLKRQVLGQ